ncbi:peptidyl-dipeptidase [Sorangium cellulosum]|uniref:Peptidyl-dipeptidase n=1 Tax=Sorangium cellulosum TaxID=56 RepID=A0A150RLJ5_SORCE|nr:peptidyl-dipeptidase [Sorangium cellulosum]KYF97647.1 peptidyl-dipeptidase [Sorangium cellulosum]
MVRMVPVLVVALPCGALALTAACSDPSPPPRPRPGSQPAAEEAQRFIEQAESVLHELSTQNNRAAWVASTYITGDTQVLAAAASAKLLGAQTDYAKRAARYRDLDLPYDVRRRLDLLRTSLTLYAPADPAKTQELATIASGLEATYGAGKYCPSAGQCLDLQELSRIIAKSRDPEELKRAWVGWRTVSAPMRGDFTRLVALANEGARELGFKDTGDAWRAKYEMPPEALPREVDRLFGQVKPLYDALHCYVRGRLAARYGEDVVPGAAPIRADLLGDMWAQDWSNIHDLVAPQGVAPIYDLDAALRAKGFTPIEMVKTGERFFVSLGFDPLPATFWERSLFVKPADRDVVCHASAWNIDDEEDVRIKMCIDVTADDFQTIHHELGHTFYQRAYNHLPWLYRDSPNPAFHEALGDTIGLSVTPAYLQRIGLVDELPPPSSDVSLLLREALAKVAFLPFAVLVDRWRWGVFSGDIPPAEYNKAWWDLRRRYQGVTPPVPRSEADFDPGAKYHVAASVPYIRYFFAHILQFQLHRALCEEAGHKGPLHRCTIYGSEQAGERLRRMMEMGRSRPWPEALEAVTGSRRMDAAAMLDYFAPLRGWLDRQNRGRTCGW